MKIVIELSSEKWQRVLDGTWCGSEEITHGIPLEKELEDIRAEIVLERDRRIGGEFYESAKYASFDKALEIIDNHINRKEQE